MWRDTGRPRSWLGGDVNFHLNYPLRAPPSILASLPTLCSYHSPEGTRSSRIDGLLVDTRLAALLRAAERLPRGAISGHTPVCFDIHPREAL